MLEIDLKGNGLVTLSGRLDASQVELARPVLEGLRHSATADLAGLDYISSAGLGLLVQTHKRLLSSGHALRVINVTPHVRNVFHYAGLDRVFGIE